MMAEGWIRDWIRFKPEPPLASPLPPATPIHPVSQPVVIASTPEMDEYRTLASALGFYPTGVEDPTLDRLLQRLGIEVFDGDAVAAFLTATCARLGPAWRWVWAPVEDVSLNSFSFSPPVYTDPIPLRVLRRMHTLRAEAPGVAFFVSRITDRPKADPFLLASLRSTSRIIDCWDEPGFTG